MQVQACTCRAWHSGFCCLKEQAGMLDSAAYLDQAPLWNVSRRWIVHDRQSNQQVQLFDVAQATKVCEYLLMVADMP